VALVLLAVTSTALILMEPPWTSFAFAFAMTAAHPREGSPVGAAEQMHETALPQIAPGPSTMALTCSS